MSYVNRNGNGIPPTVTTGGHVVPGQRSNSRVTAPPASTVRVVEVRPTASQVPLSQQNFPPRRAVVVSQAPPLAPPSPQRNRASDKVVVVVTTHHRR